MTEAAATTSATITDIIHDVVAKPVGEIVLIIIASLITIFVLVASLSFIISKLKGKVDVDFLSIFKIGKKENEQKNGINININNNTAKEEGDEKIEDLEEIKKESSRSLSLNDLSDSSDLMLVISKSVIFGATIIQYKEVFLIKTQMSMAEAKIDLIEGALIKEYMEAIFRKKGYINIQDDQSYLIYVDIIHNQVHKSNLDTILTAFKANHLVDFEDEEYDDYVSMQSERQMNNMKISINGSLPSFLEPGREVINSIIDKKQEYIFGIYRDIFYEARFSAMKVDALIKSKEKDFDEEIRKLTGIKNAHRGTGLRSIDTDSYKAETIE